MPSLSCVCYQGLVAYTVISNAIEKHSNSFRDFRKSLEKKMNQSIFEFAAAFRKVLGILTLYVACDLEDHFMDPLIESPNLVHLSIDNLREIEWKPSKGLFLCKHYNISENLTSISHIVVPKSSKISVPTSLDSNIYYYR